MAIVKAGSPSGSMSHLALTVTAVFAALGCRIWVEYIRSSDNPADPLSRGGLEDEAVRGQLAAGELIADPPQCPASHARMSFEELWTAAAQ